MTEELHMNGEDVDIEKLVPLKERDINFKNNQGYKRILTSISKVGLLEPLCTCRENDYFVILDGFIRYKALKELGIKSVPCLIYSTKEAYTFNRMVNKLSAVQESRMLRESLKIIDQNVVASVFGIKSLQYRLGTNILKQLDKKIIDAIDKGEISRKCARELTYVSIIRQVEILNEMKNTCDFSLSFARALVIKTPPEMRNKNKKDKKPWQENSEKKQELFKKLETVQKRYDFYTNIYRQYSTDLLKVFVYVRQLITNDKIRTYLNSNYPDVLERFEDIIFKTEEK